MFPLTAHGLSKDDYPALYRAADRCSLLGQRRHLRGTRARLLLLLAATVAGVGSVRLRGLNIAAVAGAVAFACAVVVDLYLRSQRPERSWYDGRAAAESVKTLTWRYVTGGEPFPVTLSPAECEQRFLRRLNSVVNTLSGLDLVPDSSDGPQISARMRALRASNLDDRKAAYRSGRLEDQQTWYGTRARENERSYRSWSSGLLAAELIGVTAAILRAAGVFDLDILGVVGGGAAGGVAWLETRQHQTLASAYAVAHHELGLILEELPTLADESWARFVDESEEAISREHTLWRASHAG